MVDSVFIFTKDFLEKEAKQVIAFFEDKIDKDFIQFFIDTYMAGEETVAYECLCGRIYESKIKLNKDIFILIKEECIGWEVSSKYWKKLEELLID